MKQNRWNWYSVENTWNCYSICPRKKNIYRINIITGEWHSKCFHENRKQTWNIYFIGHNFDYCVIGSWEWTFLECMQTREWSNWDRQMWQKGNLWSFSTIPDFLPPLDWLSHRDSGSVSWERQPIRAFRRKGSWKRSGFRIFFDSSRLNWNIL